MTYLEQVKAITDEVRPQFESLGMFAFRGEGEPQTLVKNFVDVYEAYIKVRELTASTFGDANLSVAAGSMWCSPRGGEIETADDHMQNAYLIAKEMGMLPPPLMMELGDWVMQMNHYFIAAQQKGKE